MSYLIRRLGFLPGEIVQHRTMNWKDGDHSNASRLRIPANIWRDLTQIPVHSISFNDALNILVQTAGSEEPPDWGDELNTTYRMGPQLRTPEWYKYSISILRYRFLKIILRNLIDEQENSFGGPQ